MNLLVSGDVVKQFEGIDTPTLESISRRKRNANLVVVDEVPELEVVLHSLVKVVLPHDSDRMTFALQEGLALDSFLMNVAHLHAALRMDSVRMVALQTTVPMAAVELEDPVVEESVNKVPSNPLFATSN